jgi:hypothetical protein
MLEGGVSMKLADKTVRVDVTDINIYPGQYITIWLNRNPASGKRDAVQVELRVLDNGTTEIFTHVAETHIEDFEDWYNVQ